MRESYQGITSPVARTEDYFDPGAKYHIPGNTPYTRYYLARIMQYQFHESLCNEMNFQGALHECSIYGNSENNSKIDNKWIMYSLLYCNFVLTYYILLDIGFKPNLANCDLYFLRSSKSLLKA